MTSSARAGERRGRTADAGTKTEAHYVALLRAVNLGPHNRIAMTDLRALVESLGMQDVRTLLQSGNVVFRGHAPSSGQLERTIEKALAGRLKVETDVLVRTANDWRAVLSGNPFRDEAARDPSHLLVMFMKEAPGREDVAALQRSIAGREVVRAVGRELFVVFPDGIGRSRLTAARMEQALRVRGTGRNWNTVMKLGALLGAKPDPASPAVGNVK